ncbi:GNAT family protein [Halalkalibacterium halodurans]|uniref:Ribosomal-protein-alanine N-acetyltransferase n=1 Tax=Halalkalibacterium halodurans (strain ATCC BAA-125 / DSM 18197 / FERM 7344 / JCM 9153 / C-125) TaxID=272558 RepID=Q9KF00_HALH5|nr:GNAT family protein [Halalkalibacterium halodurans]MDY7221190.1 GNAT family protein [Halalkalibacterium halodurans]MDY7240429.1 GNAT family protein [Halalkalibacterium halodurans]MED4080325.1 GNAT family protein [Halalkalibacterium halodurans]MED4084611.1 GNAT family protein [Halalkalibacterium halodurans]MED4104825.1 GNAT family protein [Halalkalibacterium halodurans]
MTGHVKRFPILETKRLILRKITTDDARSILSYLSDKEVMKYFGLEPFQTLEDALGEIAWYESILHEQTGIRWGITLKGQDEVIGSCGFHQWVPKHHRAEIGFELSKLYWGQGIASEAIRAVIQYGFEHLELQRIQALIEPPNIPSQRLVEKQGFISEGLLRSYEYTCGKFDDLYMYSLLKRDFDKIHRSL